MSNGEQSCLPVCDGGIVTLLDSDARPEQVIPSLWRELLPVLFRLPHLSAHIKVQRQPLQVRCLHMSKVQLPLCMLGALTDGKDYTITPRTCMFKRQMLIQTVMRVAGSVYGLQTELFSSTRTRGPPCAAA